jgi:hypothetical protein
MLDASVVVAEKEKVEKERRGVEWLQTVWYLGGQTRLWAEVRVGNPKADGKTRQGPAAKDVDSRSGGRI